MVGSSPQTGDAANVYHQRRNKTSVDDGEMRLDWHTKASSNSRSHRNSSGSDIIYAVVKGAPSRTSVPKLAGATGSGTSDEESRARSSAAAIGADTRTDGYDGDAVLGNPEDRVPPRRRAVAVTGGASSNLTSSTSHPPPAPSASSVALIELKRLSTQSISSTSSDTTLASSGSSNPLFDERDVEESTTLLDHELAEEAMPLQPPGIEPPPQKSSRPNKAHPDTDPQHKVSSPADSLNQERLQRAKSLLAGSKKLGEEAKSRGAASKASGIETPMATIRTSMDPSTSALDNADPLFQPTAPLVTFPVLDAYLASLKPPNFSVIPESVEEDGDTSASGKSSSSSPLKDGALFKSKDERPPPVPEKPKSTMAVRASTVDSTASKDSKSSSASKGSSKSKNEKPDPRKGMFPPLDKVPVGVSLDELKANITKPAGFFDQELQNVLLTSTADGIMSGESTNIGISWMRFEIVRDFLQYMGLYLSVSGNSYSDQKWLYASVNVIPAAASLDLSRVLGYGGIFLALFGLVAAIAMYTFKIMTKTDPNDDIEGLEVSSWSLRSKAKRIETIAIVFLLTTIYLPLAKFALDALVWSDTMWAVKNPYKTTDKPTWEPLGPADIFRAPDDFCYVTSMRIQDLNLAYVIIPLAVSIIIVNTIYFPLAVRRLVVVNLPRVDKYTEQGDQRLDPDEEYKRITNQDTCPYNFLYNGYRRECGTYKVSVMFTKLLAVVIVVIFSKDNCIFRNTNRMVIEAIRASLQILLTIGLIVRHYMVQPYLYQSQNISEYCTRACSVATSLLGLLIVVRAGPVNLLGILLTSTYVVMCVIVIWFVVRQTQKFQMFLKQLQRRLDFSLEIYNPRLNYAKHIKRRVWQETWTTVLLTAKTFKMPTDKVVAYSQSPHRPPYLLNFTGTVAERHVENLKIIRQIGLRNYTRACRFLTPAILRKRTMILREYVGPDMYYAPELMASNVKTYFGKAYVVPFPFSVVFVYDESSVVVTLVREKELDRYLQQNQDAEIQRRREIRQQLRALDGKFVIRPFIETRSGTSHHRQREREDQGGSMEMSLVNAPISYKRGLFTIHRKKTSTWKGHNMNPGFSVTITYTDGEISDPQGSPQLFHETTIGHSIIGITRDFQVTPALAKLLRDNHELIRRNLPKVHKVMRAYKDHYRREAHHKDETLSYGFFLNIYDNPTLRQSELGPVLMATEENSLLRFPDRELTTTIQFLYERMAMVHSSICHQWWYLFWDDLYRKNHEEIPQLIPASFSPAFPTSICYQPMPRAELEQFLEKHGCWLKHGRSGFMHVGVLNRIYAFLNRLVFEDMRLRRCQRQQKPWQRLVAGSSSGPGSQQGSQQQQPQQQRWWYGPQGQGDDLCFEKYWEISTAERTRIKNLWVVAEARVDSDGSIKKIYRTSNSNEGQDDQPASGGTGTIKRKPSRRILGWFDSITPRRHPSHKVPNYSKDEEDGGGGGGNGAPAGAASETSAPPPSSSSSGKGKDSDSPGKDSSNDNTNAPGTTTTTTGTVRRRRSGIISLGYIIPQTLQQKAAMFSELIIGGSKDVIGDSDEEDDLGPPTERDRLGSSYARYRPHNGRVQMGTITEGAEDEEEREGDDEDGYGSDEEDEDGHHHGLQQRRDTELTPDPSVSGRSSNKSSSRRHHHPLDSRGEDGPKNPFMTPDNTLRAPRLVTPSSRHELVRTSSEQTIVGNPFLTEAEVLDRKKKRDERNRQASQEADAGRGGAGDNAETQLLLDYGAPARDASGANEVTDGALRPREGRGDGGWTRVDMTKKSELHQQQIGAANDEDAGIASDSMSIASMSSEDFW
ncbi:hypothetical protein DFQ27_007447 [Actinomortierella ambigua]|uniref:Uncharacterized protein n=1 Tax=Actinomortierella ambigua TaxID=1343610 RepID=A0A9P6PSX2_9FUNG|nr:hypothetical protein DFQ27_007447 [Actinomortierella ambigua]